MRCYCGLEKIKEKKKKHTQRVDLQICEEQIFIQVEKSNNETGQDAAEKERERETISSVYKSLIFGLVAAVPELNGDVWMP